MKKQLVELLGTFFLVLTVGLAVKAAGSFAPLAIWSVLMVMIYAGGHISGAHYNPAVTLWVFLRGKIWLSDAISYVVAQIIGAILAWLLVVYLVGSIWWWTLGGDTLQVIIAELLFTFALVYVVCGSATSDATAGKWFYGLAIWFTVLVGALAVGGISGGAFNPAVAIWGIFDGTFLASNIWMHIVGNLAGAALAAITYNYVESK